MKDGAVVLAKTYLKATHPTQVVRHLVSSTPNSMDFFNIHIISFDGDYWNYSVHKKNNQFILTSVRKQSLAIPRGYMETLMAGNMSIKEVVAYG